MNLKQFNFHVVIITSIEQNTNNKQLNSLLSLTMGFIVHSLIHSTVRSFADEMSFFILTILQFFLLLVCYRLNPVTF